ncbi:hypothetical protein K443DRAFT_681719 [Laccaria amethystina LaAM-08-1]|uniref:Uncharacterized protein n=1 Tax=Laccaria amethystina LaAM-08-1 TaxID=1095629 RepID=A0A0C9XHK4_9AGAR|nr:hypothetical protein K443DRAFT_681719 [Laccaria amethystina LaAM-08-1]
MTIATLSFGSSTPQLPTCDKGLPRKRILSSLYIYHHYKRHAGEGFILTERST